MAITNTNHLIRLPDVEYVDIGPIRYNRTTQYVYDCVSKKEDPSIIVKWCRRNFGQRGSGWDFLLTSGRVTILLWDDKYITMYEMWHN